MVRWPEGRAKAASAKQPGDWRELSKALGRETPAEQPLTRNTGPAALKAALESLDLDELEREARGVVDSKAKTKRPRAVRVLNILEGLRRNRISPQELMVSKVPVVPPLFRQYAVEGSTFIPGDANELYRDLFKARKAYEEETEAFGEPFGDTAKNLRDAVRALYGYGDPVEPKTRERGVSGFMAKLTGDGSSKYSYMQRKMLSKTQDNVGRSTIVPDPELGMDEIGVPEDMAWESYKPYIQRGLVRKGHSLANSLLAVVVFPGSGKTLLSVLYIFRGASRCPTSSASPRNASSGAFLLTRRIPRRYHKGEPNDQTQRIVFKEGAGGAGLLQQVVPGLHRGRTTHRRYGQGASGEDPRHLRTRQAERGGGDRGQGSRQSVQGQTFPPAH